MTAAGWTFVEVWETETWRNPTSVVQRIEAARRDLRRDRRPNLYANRRWSPDLRTDSKEVCQASSSMARMISETGRNVSPAVERCA